MKSTLRTMVVSLTLMTALAGGILGAVRLLSAPRAAQAAESRLRQALVDILPPFDTITEEPDSTGLTLYRASSDGHPAGIAVESFSDNGFGGRITVLFGFDASGALHSYTVLSHNETPGLGAGMDKWFMAGGTAHTIIGATGPLAVSKDGGSVDAISGATITSRAFLNAYNRARSAAFPQP